LRDLCSRIMTGDPLFSSFVFFVNSHCQELGPPRFFFLRWRFSHLPSVPLITVAAKSFKYITNSHSLWDEFSSGFSFPWLAQHRYRVDLRVRFPTLPITVFTLVPVTLLRPLVLRRTVILLHSFLAYDASRASLRCRAYDLSIATFYLERLSPCVADSGFLLFPLFKSDCRVTFFPPISDSVFAVPRVIAGNRPLE